MNNDLSNMAHYIDHTLLKADATTQQIQQLCDEALHYQFYSVCINTAQLPLAKSLLATGTIKLCSVIGFPLGAELTKIKVFAAETAIQSGADELDMVMNIGWLKSGNINAVQQDIAEIFAVCADKPLKVILETALLTRDEIITACQLCSDIGVAFVKTSTGFAQYGARVEDVMLMRQCVGEYFGVKASGGIKHYQDAKMMIAAGASRIGTSCGVAIMQEMYQLT